MELGAFSVSLAVSDLAASQRFYELLGFEVVDGSAEEGWLILANGPSKLGLFEGLFEENLLTWNPTDVRAIQHRLEQAGQQLLVRSDPQGMGAAHAILADPDGNRILLDQLA